MTFLGQGFHKLEHEQERQTDRERETRPSALPAAFADHDKHTSAYIYPQ